MGQSEAGCRIATKKRHQVLHRRVCRQLALPHKSLDLVRQLLHQRKTPRHPARATAKTTGQLDHGETLAVKRRKQPPLFQSCRRGRCAKTMSQQQRLAVAHLPHHRPHRVHTQTGQGTDSLVTVDDTVKTRRRRRHYHHRLLLSVLLQAR